jgi:hypothetical protein
MKKWNSGWKKGTSNRQYLVSRVYIDRNGCWLWAGGILPGGYGHVPDGRGEPLAHRLSWITFRGPIPEGLHLDHLCRVRSCIRPSHLEPVTMRENILRGTSPSAENAIKTHCPRGHAYDGDNLQITPRGFRHCRTCRALTARRSRMLQKWTWNLVPVGTEGGQP